MSMSEEELEKTGILKVMLNKADSDEESTLLEKIEMFEERLDYLNVEEEKKEKLKDLISKIKEEEDEKVQGFLFKELEKMVEDE
ncbi:MAG: hypothetical protein IKH54_06305 [Bacilli bacterium]|nr:hypothetical protein [Bacilli bacterium]MBR6949774.1 hypothetical protein [Bacilli bacterium]